MCHLLSPSLFVSLEWVWAGVVFSVTSVAVEGAGYRGVLCNMAEDGSVWDVVLLHCHVVGVRVGWLRHRLLLGGRGGLGDAGDVPALTGGTADPGAGRRYGGSRRWRRCPSGAGP